MDALSIEQALNSFSVIVDNREQNTPKARERYEALGVPYGRATLRYGDYCGNITLPGGEALYNINEPISAKCVIERKMSLDEAAACFTRERDRFRREFERAKEAQAKTFLLIEGGSWEAIYQHRYRSKFNPSAFAASLEAWVIRYDLTLIFCKPETSGRLIKELLYRELKNQLETGVFDS